LLSPTERTLRARLAAYSLHARGGTNVGPARAAYDARWAKLVDPEGLLAPDERERRAEHARKAHFTKMAFESAKSRRRGQSKKVTAPSVSETSLEAVGGGQASDDHLE
jgi:hypothetical protein